MLQFGWVLLCCLSCCQSMVRKRWRSSCVFWGGALLRAGDKLVLCLKHRVRRLYSTTQVQQKNTWALCASVNRTSLMPLAVYSASYWHEVSRHALGLLTAVVQAAHGSWWLELLICSCTFALCTCPCGLKCCASGGVPARGYLPPHPYPQAFYNQGPIGRMSSVEGVFCDAARQCAGR